MIVSKHVVAAARAKARWIVENNLCFAANKTEQEEILFDELILTWGYGYGRVESFPPNEQGVTSERKSGIRS